MLIVGDFRQLPPVDGDNLRLNPVFTSIPLNKINLIVQKRSESAEYAHFLQRLSDSIESKVYDPEVANTLDYILSTDLGFRPRPKNAQFLSLLREVSNSINNNAIQSPVITIGNTSLTHGCPVQLTRNIYNSSKAIFANGDFATFLHLEKNKKEFKEGEFSIKQCKNATVVVSCHNTVIRIPIFKRDIGVEPAFCVRVHRVQGLTIKGRMHINFKGIENFDPKVIYVALSRGTNFNLVSCENLNSDVLHRLLS